MRLIIAILLAFLEIGFSLSSYACDWDMRNWRRQEHGRWHGHEFYGCPHMAPEVAKKFPKMPGAELFQSKGCVGCHTIGEGDKVGPDLTGLFKRRDEKWIREFIRDPAAKIQTDAQAKNLQEHYGSQMPQMNLSRKELDQLVKFLKTATQ